MASESKQLEVLDLPLIDLNSYFNKDKNADAAEKECKLVAEALHKYGCLLVRDPRVDEKDNAVFIDQMEEYFAISDGKRDARPEFSFQVGVTPENTERPRNHCSKVKEMAGEDKPQTVCPPEADPKWRFFWRMGEMPKETRFKAMNMEPVVPKEFPQWKDIMDRWGTLMLNAVNDVSSMAAIGFGLPADTFTKMMHCGPHLLAPTGSDFNKFNKIGTVLAGYHYDLNFLTIHGKSRFPGLHVWRRDGKKCSVKIPDGCLLVQAGKQIEYVTGGYCLAGFHEVLVTDQTAKVIEAKREKKESLWRVSSTLFSHMASDQKLRPLGHFANEESVKLFPEIYAGDQVMAELNAIALGAGFTLNGKGEEKTESSHASI